MSDEKHKYERDPTSPVSDACRVCGCDLNDHSPNHPRNAQQVTGGGLCDLCIAPHSLVQVDRRCEKHAPARWHEVEVGALPSPEGERVLIAWAGAGHPAIARWLNDGADGRGWYDAQDRRFVCPTHWHPLPQAPEPRPPP